MGGSMEVGPGLSHPSHYVAKLGWAGCGVHWIRTAREPQQLAGRNVLPNPL